MTIKYALRQKTPDHDLKREHGFGRILNRFTITEVSQEIAESHENGVYGVFNTSDKRISAWIYIDNPVLQEKLAKVKPGKPLADRMGTLLSIGDYVFTTFDSSHFLCLARVVGFTPQYVRIQDLQRNWDQLATKTPEHLIKISHDLITP